MTFDFLSRADFPLKKFVYISILAVLFAFLTFVGSRRIEPAGLHGTARLFVSYYGFPLEWLEVYSWKSGYNPYEGEANITEGMSRMNFALGALILDFIFCFLLASVVVYGIAKLTNR